MPDLPLLKFVQKRDRIPAIVEALRAIPNFKKLRVRDISAKYQLPQSTASSVLARLREYR